MSNPLLKKMKTGYPVQVTSLINGFYFTFTNHDHCHIGILAIITSLIFTPRTGGIFGVIWARVNSFLPR